MNHVFGYELLPLKPNRHFTVFKRSADVHPPSQNVHLDPLAFVNGSAFLSKKPFCPSFLFKTRFFAPAWEREPLQSTGLQEGVTQSICRATDTISTYINHISTARPRAPAEVTVSWLTSRMQPANQQRVTVTAEHALHTVTTISYSLWGLFSQ